MAFSDLTVEARDLKIGDLLVPTNREVVWVGQTIKTPARKITVHLRRRGNGISYQVSHFWRGTTITIMREVAAEESAQKMLI